MTELEVVEKDAHQYVHTCATKPKETPLSKIDWLIMLTHIGIAVWMAVTVVV